MAEFRPFRKDGSGVSPVIGVIAMVAITVGIASVLYTSVGGTLTSGSHSCLGPQVRIQSTDAGWYARFVAVVSGTLPEGVLVEVKAPDGSVVLERTSLSRLAPGSGAAFVDGNPDVDEVRPGDAIFLEASRFSEGSRLAISDRSGMVTVRVLG